MIHMKLFFLSLIIKSKLFVTSIDCQVAIPDFIGKVHNHFPKSPLIAIAAKHKWIIPIITKIITLANGPMYFTDTNKTLKAGYTGPTTKICQSTRASVQQDELEAIEGNGNPHQCSCLESPRDGGAWWAAIYGVAQSWTRLEQLSSSSSYLITGCFYSFKY